MYKREDEPLPPPPVTFAPPANVQVAYLGSVPEQIFAPTINAYSFAPPPPPEVALFDPPHSLNLGNNFRPSPLSLPEFQPAPFHSMPFQTTTFRNSPFNPSHFQSENFQPEIYQPPAPSGGKRERGMSHR